MVNVNIARRPPDRKDRLVRSTPTRSWRGVSAEERRAERRAQLIEAGLEVIGTKGWSGTTVQSVCRTAGLTERYFYEAFSDRDALLIAVYDHVVDEAAAAVLQAIATAPRDFRRTVRAVITAGVELLTSDPRKGRLIAVEAAVHETLQLRRREAVRAQAELLTQLTAEFFGKRADPADTHLNALGALGAVTEIGSAYLAGWVDIPKDRLIDHLTGMVVAAAGVTSTT